LVVGQPLLFEALHEMINVAPTNNKKRSAVVFFIIKGLVKRFVSVLYYFKDTYLLSNEAFCKV